MRHPKEFQFTYSLRCSVSDGWLVIYGSCNNLPYSRLGISVSRKYGNAVHRNRLRRLYREAFRLERNELPKGLDFILIPRGQQEPNLKQLQQSLRKLLPLLAERLKKRALKQESGANSCSPDT